MWRYVAGGTAALALAGAGLLAFGGAARPGSVLPPAPARVAQVAEATDEAPAALPEATPATREERRFGRYDKDDDGAITREEYLVSRRKAYAKLDRDGDGRLSFDEWATKTTTKFASADRDRSGSMNATEFATTAVKRRPAPRRANCPPPPSDEG